MSTPKKSALKRLTIVCVSLVLSILLAELGMRGWLAVRGTPYDSSATRESVEAMLDPIRHFVPDVVEQPDTLQDGSPFPILHPFTGAETWHDTGNVLKYFRDRGTWDDYKILIVGGSVASLFVRNARDELIELFTTSPALEGRTITVLNYAHPSYKQPQQLNRVAYLLELGARFDAVINLDGFNETALAYENSHRRTHPVYPSAPTWAAALTAYGSGSVERFELAAQMLTLRDAARTIIERALRFHFTSSCLLGTWTLKQLNGVNARRAQLQEAIGAIPDSVHQDPRILRQVHGPDYPADEAARMEMCVTAWFEGSISLDAICRARGILYLHVLQPALGDTGSKPLTEAEAAIVPPGPDWFDGPRIGYPLLRQRGAELVARGVAFVDASQVFRDETARLYDDPCHFQPQGSSLLAKRIAPDFLRLLAKR